MSNVKSNLRLEKACGSFLYELQKIWDEVGESVAERDQMLFELEQDCLDVYRRKVDQANRSRAQLRQAIADSEAELAAICSAMGERPLHIRQPDQNDGGLKEELRLILPELDEMRKRKLDRRNEFLEILGQIQIISKEIYGSEYILSKVDVDETDLSLRKLEEMYKQLNALQKEKIDRLKLVQDHQFTLSTLCSVLGMKFKQTISEIHPTFGSSEEPMDITSAAIDQLTAEIKKLREIKLQRMQRLQDLATTMLELWNLMDTPTEEQQQFQNVTCNIAASEHEITEPNSLSIDSINNVEEEVSRLEELKSSKMKELLLKKRLELEEICRKTHLVPEEDFFAKEDAIEAIESGSMDPACVLEKIELEIAKVKEEAFSRKEILEKVEKWLAACDEECWLEEYNRDENRYNAVRGAHLTYKRAEKARSLVNKLPGMVDALASKTMSWEKERGTEFNYDGVRLLSMLEEYVILRQEKEQERRRQREQKKLQGQLIAERETLYGSKPSPSKTHSVKKAPRMSTGGTSSRRLSLGGAMLSKLDQLHSTKATPYSRPARKGDQSFHQDEAFGASPSVNSLFPDTTDTDAYSTDAHEIESSMIRKPFSPISSTLQQPKANKTNSTDDPKIIRFETLPKAIPATDNSPFTTTTSKINSFVADEENMTPKASMQTAMTPAHDTEEDVPEGIEYSFEERRVGFVLPITQTISMIQV